MVLINILLRNLVHISVERKSRKNLSGTHISPESNAFLNIFLYRANPEKFVGSATPRIKIVHIYLLSYIQGIMRTTV